MTRILFVCDCIEQDGQPFDEQLDAALACAAMGLDVKLCLTPESSVKAAQTSFSEALKDKLKMLPLYDITEVLVATRTSMPSALTERLKANLNQVRAISATELNQLISERDHVIHL